MLPAYTPSPVPHTGLVLTATALDLPAGTAMLTLAMLPSLPANQRGVVDSIVAMLEDTLVLDVAPGPPLDSGYRWLLRATRVEQYAAMFKSYFDFIGVHCGIAIAPALRQLHLPSYARDS
jgi:hypothetical protein